jgi:hypothetical protein
MVLQPYEDKGLTADYLIHIRKLSLEGLDISARISKPFMIFLSGIAVTNQ